MKCIFKNIKGKGYYSYFITNLYTILYPRDVLVDPSSGTYMQISSLEELVDFHKQI